MASQLMNIVTFANVGAGATVAAPHNINVNGVAKIPDILGGDVAGFTITADDTDVSVTNNNAAPTTINVWAEFKHSMLRQFGNPATQQLAPAPFVFSPGGVSGGGGGAVTTDASLSGDGSAGDPLLTNPWGVQTDFSFTGFQQFTRMTRISDDLFGTVNGYESAANLISNAFDVGGRREMGGWKLAVNVTNDSCGVTPTWVPNAGVDPGGCIAFEVTNCSRAGFDSRARLGIFGEAADHDCAFALGFIRSLALGSIDLTNVRGGAFVGSFSKFADNHLWCLVRDDAATEWTFDTGLDLDALWDTIHRFTIVWNKAAETWSFYIDGVLVTAINSAGFSGAQTGGGMSMYMINTAALVADTFIDWIDMAMETELPR